MITGIDVFDGTLSGPTAIAFIKGEPVEPAKALRDFAKTPFFFCLKPYECKAGVSLTMRLIIEVCLMHYPCAFNDSGSSC